MDDKKCFNYLCEKFPNCKHAVLSCGVDGDWIDESQKVKEDECGKENDYPYFVKREW